MKRYIISVMITAFSLGLYSQPKIDDPGVSKHLAEYRKQQIDSISYDLTFDIPEQISEAVKAKLRLNATVLDLSEALFIDFKAQSSYLNRLEVNGKPVNIIHYNGYIKIPQNELVLGNNLIEIDFRAGELSLNRNEDYLYTLLVPDRASTLFPCFDQPNLKATYILKITAPASWEVICGAPLLAATTKNGWTTHQFEPTDLVSTYLFSFVAGKFNKVEATTNIGSKLLFRETDSIKVELSIPEIFNLHKQALDFLEDYTNYPFPFKKLDYATIPGFQYGGMEHLGAIQYRESTLFLDDSATINQLLSRAQLIAHEAAHMWFGNLVTMNWFDDVWLKEVFANFMADKIITPSFPDVNHDLQFMFSHYPSAYSEDRTQGATPIKQNLENLKEAGTLYGRIIYNKAPIMMRQLETVMGKEAFRLSLQQYLNAFANSNADWNDLVGIMDANTAVDMRSWSDVWVNQSGRPIFTEHLAIGPNGTIENFEIQQQAEDGTNKVWVQKFDIGLVYKDTTAVYNITIDAQSNIIKSLEGKLKPEHIIYNYNGYGYGVFPIATSSVDNIPSIKNEVARGYSYINLYENMLNGRQLAQTVFDVFISGLRTETEPVILNYLVVVLQQLRWHNLPVELQTLAAETIQNESLALLEGTATNDLKKAYFNLLKTTASSISAQQLLADVVMQKQTFSNLKLNQDDLIDVGFTLAVIHYDSAEEILDHLKSKITNADKLKRFEFIVPSTSNNIEIRDAFMARLSDSKHREKEAWVSTALGYLHHPLRQKESIGYLKTSLELLEEIQQTADIFFPKRWLTATIGNYSSEAAKNITDQFLASNPNLPLSLKHKLLQAADGLYR